MSNALSAFDPTTLLFVPIASPVPSYPCLPSFPHLPPPPTPFQKHYTTLTSKTEGDSLNFDDGW